MAAIETDGLTKRFGDVTAVDGLDLEVPDGEAFGFLGPNGAGKTTTIMTLLDFVRPTAGSATVLGLDSRAEPMAIRRRVGLLPEGFSLYDRFSGRRHVAFAIESKGGDEDPDALCDRVGLDREDARRPVGEYSKGMVQRLAMAMALAGDPDLLVLDEPSSGLDPTGIQEMRRLLREEVADGTTVFFSSHILGQVEAVCDRVAIMADGSLAAVDTIEGLRETADLGARLVLTVDSVPDVDLAAVEGVADVTVEDGRIALTCIDPTAKALAVRRTMEAGATVLDLDVEEPSLEEVFAAYTGEGDA